MNKKELKLTIITNISVLALTFIMLVSVSLAWFISSGSSATQQIVQVGVFKINFEENVSADNITQVIALDSAYPMSQPKAEALALSAEKNVYTFSIENMGTVSGQLMISAKAVEDTNFAIANSTLKSFGSQVSFATKIYPFGSVDSDYPWVSGGNIFNGDNADNVNLKKHFTDTMLTLSGENYKAKEDYILYPPVLSKTSKLIFKLLVWMDEDATLESMGTANNSNPSFKFNIKIKALQHGGGAGFTAEHIAYKATDEDPAFVEVS